MDELDVFGKGGIREDIPDPRDYQWGRDVGSSAVPFDWTKGYDIEEVVKAKLGVPFKLPVKNQNGSSSCGGQAWAYLGQVLDTLNDLSTEEKSAKFIYAYTHIGVGGSDGRTNCNLVISKGWGNEADCSSYEKGLPPSEAFMIDTASISAIAIQNAFKDRGLAYANVLDRDPDNIATAIRDNYGCVIGVTGTNNGTWRTTFPLAPTEFANSWNHWLYIGKCKMINGKRHFGILNSWGADVGDGGWQWLSEDYMSKFILGYPVVWAIFTMVAKADVIIPPPYLFTKILKLGDKNGDVKMLQMKLGGLTTDGIFGQGTFKAVVKFQLANGLKGDGVVGPKTNVVLNTI